MDEQYERIRKQLYNTDGNIQFISRLLENWISNLSSCFNYLRSEPPLFSRAVHPYWCTRCCHKYISFSTYVCVTYAYTRFNSFTWYFSCILCVSNQLYIYKMLFYNGLVCFFFRNGYFRARALPTSCALLPRIYSTVHNIHHPIKLRRRTQK